MKLHLVKTIGGLKPAFDADKEQYNKIPNDTILEQIENRFRHAYGFSERIEAENYGGRPRNRGNYRAFTAN